MVTTTFLKAHYATITETKPFLPSKQNILLFPCCSNVLTLTKHCENTVKDRGLHWTTVKDIVSEWRTVGIVRNLPRSGKPAKIYPKKLIQEVTKDPRRTSKELQGSLASAKVSVHDSTTGHTRESWEISSTIFRILYCACYIISLYLNPIDMLWQDLKRAVHVRNQFVGIKAVLSGLKWLVSKNRKTEATHPVFTIKGCYSVTPCYSGSLSKIRHCLKIWNQVINMQ